MKLKANSSNFEPCPEFTGKAVCVDVTPLRKQQSQYGERDVFKVVFEIDMDRDDGSRFCVWSRPFTPSLNEKANFRKFVRGWFGRDLSQQELNDFDTDSLIGKAAQVVVVHEHKDGETYANIVACTPDKTNEPLKATGKYVRVKDRQPEAGHTAAGAAGTASNGTNGSSGTYRRAQPATAAPTEDFNTVKIHVGRCKGLELRDLAPEQVQALIEKWMPTAKAAEKQTADDKRLIAALDAWSTANKAKEEDNIPY